MASASSTKLVRFPCLFLACLFLFTFSNNLVVAKESDKVKLNLYYESLCPYSQNFIVNGLGKIFDSDLYTITTLKLIPFGNAKLSDNLTVTCQSLQFSLSSLSFVALLGGSLHLYRLLHGKRWVDEPIHGEEECKLNALEACAIRALPVPYKFIRCVEADPSEWESCAKKSGREKAIKDCYNSDLSKKLILRYAKQTMSLKPKHEFVPWVTVNGKPLYEKFDDFVAQICKVYKGKSLPKICNSSTFSDRKVSKLQVSYVDEATNH